MKILPGWVVFSLLPRRQINSMHFANGTLLTGHWTKIAFCERILKAFSVKNFAGLDVCHVENIGETVARQANAFK